MSVPGKRRAGPAPGPGSAGRNRSGQGRSGASAGRPARPAPPRRARPQQPPAPAGPPVDVHDPAGVRLQKVLAQAGVGSRRACEELIVAGRVTVDGHPVTELGVRVDPKKVAVHVDGIRVQLDESLVYLVLNKPLGVLSAMSDPQGRDCIGDLVASRAERLFHVGRLDADSEGLILLTNDGELANRLSHPRYEVPKVYLAEVEGQIPRDLGRRLREGIELDDGAARVDGFRVVDARPGKALVEVTLHDGRNRIVRRLLEAAGHPVLQLVRIQVGPIKLGDLRVGRTRALGRPEVASLMAAAGL
ncbi:MAG TPA: pseudouridine synthase [Kineosporiaceae bacterium]